MRIDIRAENYLHDIAHLCIRYLVFAETNNKLNIIPLNIRF